MMITVWKCNKCGKSGKVTHGVHADVHSVYRMVTDSHEIKSPRCKFDENRVKIEVYDGLGKRMY